MKVIFLIILLFLVLFCLIGNAGRELFRFLQSAGLTVRGTLFFVCYALVTTGILALFIASYLWREMPHPLAVFAQFAVGFLILFVLVTDLLSVILLTVRILRGMRATPLGVRFAAGVAALIFTIGLFSYGSYHALDIKTKRYAVTLDKPCAPLRIALISDLHLGHVTGAGRLFDIKDAINAQSPDIVLIAGDIFDSDLAYLQDPDAAVRIFSEFSAPMGVWACLGNHDAGETYPAMLAFLEKAGVHLLRDEARTVEDRLVVAGRRDSRPISESEERQPLTLEASDLPVIVLDHQPQNYTAYTAAEVDLVLCGHTHRGQFFPGNLITHALYDVDYGSYRKDASFPRVIVTSGAGFWGPVLRIGTDSEIVLIDLQGK